MVDPQLGRQANGDAVRPPSQPYSGGVPPTRRRQRRQGRHGQLMKAPAPLPRQGLHPVRRGARGGDARRPRRSARRMPRPAAARSRSIFGRLGAAASRRPAALSAGPRHRGGGREGGKCQLRVVSFSAPRSRCRRCSTGTTPRRSAPDTAPSTRSTAEHILGGTRERDDGAYVLFLTARSDGGTDVDLVANNGN
jgi:hypothetical protein